MLLLQYFYKDGTKMARNYNLGSNADMQRFMQDLKSSVMYKAESAIQAKSFEADCPKCKAKTSVAEGRNVCPHCGAEFKLSLGSH